MEIFVFGLIFFAGGGLFVVLALFIIRSQVRRLRTWVPVPAVIESSRVIDFPGQGSKYSAIISYRYEVAGQSYLGEKYGQFESSGSMKGMYQKIVDRYPPGLATQAYVNPADPTQAVLSLGPSVFPYAMVMFAMIHTSIGLFMALAWPRLTLTWADQLLITAGVWNVVGIACLLHYRMIGGKLTMLPSIVFAIYGAVGMIMLMVWSGLAKYEPPPATQPATQPLDPEPLLEKSP